MDAILTTFAGLLFLGGVVFIMNGTATTWWNKWHTTRVRIQELKTEEARENRLRAEVEAHQHLGN